MCCCFSGIGLEMVQKRFLSGTNGVALSGKRTVYLQRRFDFADIHTEVLYFRSLTTSFVVLNTSGVISDLIEERSNRVNPHANPTQPRCSGGALHH